MLRPLITIGCLTVAGAVSAEPVPLTSESIKANLSGAMLEMDTPLGTKIPIRFSKNGLVSGEAGILASMLGAEKDRGRWWTKNDELCVKWFRWFEAKPKCASLRLDGSRIYWRERGGETGTGTLAERPAPPTPPAAPPVTVAKSVEPAAPVAEPQRKPEQQIATADVTPPITQRKIETEPLEEGPPSLMFAGVSGMPDVAGLISKSKPQPAAEQPNEVAALAAPLSQPPATVVADPPRQPSPVQAATETPAPRAEPDDAEEAIVDIDAMTGPAIRAVSFRVSGVRADDMLNVRSGPSEFHEPVGRIPPAARGVKIIGQCRGEWCPIRRGRLKGWVNSFYLAEETAATNR